MKTLLIGVYKHQSSVFPDNDCSNGGVSGKYDNLMLKCDDGPFETDENDPQLVELKLHMGHPIIVPCNNTDPTKTIGPMMGGAFGYSSDSRFSKLVSKLYGDSFYGGVPIHDRYETPEQYEALSR